MNLKQTYDRLKRWTFRLWRNLFPRRTKHHFPSQRRRGTLQPAQPRPFTLERRAGYLLFGWGTLPGVSPNAIFYLRLRRIQLAEPSHSVQTRRLERQAIAQLILTIERRRPASDLWRELLSDPPTHVLRFGYQHRKTRQNRDVCDLFLRFAFPGRANDSLAEAFGEQFLKGLERNLSLTWYLCPRAEMRRTAALYWLQSAFADWQHDDLGTERS